MVPLKCVFCVFLCFVFCVVFCVILGVSSRILFGLFLFDFLFFWRDRNPQI